MAPAVTDEDLAPEPARTIYERRAANESIRALGGYICDWCRLPMTAQERHRTGHPECTKAWLRSFKDEAETVVVAREAAAEEMGPACTKVTIEGWLNGRKYAVSAERGAEAVKTRARRRA